VHNNAGVMSGSPDFAETDMARIVDTAIVPRDQEWLKPVLAAVKMLSPDDIALSVCGIVEDDTLSGDFVTVDHEMRAA